MDNSSVVRKGVSWTSLSTIVTAVSGILRLAILTRFLEKEDFGVVSIVTLMLGLTQTFSDLGFAAAIMHKQNLSRREFSSLYWVQFIIYTLIFLIISLFSGVISDFYKTPILKQVLPISLLGLIVTGVGRLYGTLLQKNFEFRTIALRNIISAFLSLLLAILLAYLGWGVYSLVLSTLFHMLVDNMWNFIAGQKKIKLQPVLDIKGSIPLIKIGLYQTGSQAIDYMASKIDVVLVGKFLGMEILGVYNLAKELLLKFITLINSIAVNVLTPIFSINQNDKTILGHMYCKMINYLTFITFPIVMLMVVLAKPIILVLYGEQYIEASSLILLLTPWTIEVCIHNPIGGLVVATGRTDLSFYYTLVRIILNTIAVFIAVNFTIQIVAIGQSIAAIVIFFLVFYMIIQKCTEISLMSFIKSFYKQGLLCVFLGLLCFYIVDNNILSINDKALSQFVIYGILSSVLCIIIYFTLFRETILKILKKQSL